MHRVSADENSSEVRVSAVEENSKSPTKRRKSLKNLSSRFDKSEILPENDDEAERRERRRQSEIFANRDRRLSVGGIANFTSAELVAHYANCIKLSTENKINTKNAFNLQLIDYMSAMLRKEDSAMNNFQVASCTLDASTKIYASRVDRVHKDVFQLASGLGILPSRRKQADKDDDGEDGNANKRTKRPKELKRCFLRNEESLNGEDKQDYRLDPIYMYMNYKFGDSQPGVINFMGQMNIRDDNAELIMFPQECYWKKKQHESSKASSSVLLPSLPSTLKGKKLCPSFQRIFLENESSLDFNLPDTGPPIDLEVDLNDQPNDPDEDLGMVDDSNVDETMSTDAPPVSCQAQQTAANIIDIREHLSLKPLEYSYFNQDRLLLWAGPSHWKIRPFAKEKAACASRNTTEKRERKNVELNFDDLENVGSLYVKGKSLLMSRRTMEKTWSVEKNTHPRDEHYDEKNLTRLFLRKYYSLQLAELNGKISANEEKDDVEGYDSSNAIVSQDYNHDVEDDDRGENGIDNDGDVVNGESMRPTDGVQSVEHAASGWKLVTPPPQVARVIIPYALAEKKLNMKKLKGAIWNVLTNKESIVNDGVQMDSHGSEARMSSSFLFSDLYSRLLQELPKIVTKDLSVHILFTALLHLSNEKVLSLKGNSENSDFLITQD